MDWPIAHLASQVVKNSALGAGSKWAQLQTVYKADVVASE